ncbi:hypothetical protein ACFL5K_01350 [Gemmatimonadota bacterium]
MNATLITEWINSEKGWLDPPGCETDFAPHPTGKDRCCTVGIVHEHRFAFYFWGRYSIDKGKLPLPTLITLDSHDDVGVPSEVIRKDLDNLDINDRIELGLFAWLRLRSLNDGHIRPALYLNFFSDVYVLLNNDGDFCGINDFPHEEQQLDRNNHPHAIKYYQDTEQLLRNIPPEGPIFFDIDLDYFALVNPDAGSVKGSERLRSDEEIASILSINGELIGSLLDRIVGLTIALEPSYCGGLVNSLHVLDILNRELFDGTLCTHSCKWRNRNIQQLHC